MMKLRLVLGVLLAAAAATWPAAAQHAAPGPSGFVTLYGGLTHYYGDLQTAPLDGSALDVGTVVEAGYRLSPSFAVALAYQRGHYAALATDRASGRREAVYLLLHYAPVRFGRWQPVLTAGLHATEGADYAGFGPVAGVGAEVDLWSRMALLARVLTSIALPDAAIDGVLVDHLSGVDRRHQLDLLTHLGLGLRVYL